MQRVGRRQNLRYRFGWRLICMSTLCSLHFQHIDTCFSTYDFLHVLLFGDVLCGHMTFPVYVMFGNPGLFGTVSLMPFRSSLVQRDPFCKGFWEDCRRESGGGGIFWGKAGVRRVCTNKATLRVDELRSRIQESWCPRTADVGQDKDTQGLFTAARTMWRFRKSVWAAAGQTRTPTWLS